MYIFSEESLRLNLSKSDNCERSFATRGETMREERGFGKERCGTGFDGVTFPLSQCCGTFLTRIGATVEA
jgi:hypothetical protein